MEFSQEQLDKIADSLVNRMRRYLSKVQAIGAFREISGLGINESYDAIRKSRSPAGNPEAREHLHDMSRLLRRRKENGVH